MTNFRNFFITLSTILFQLKATKPKSRAFDIETSVSFEVWNLSCFPVELEAKLTYQTIYGPREFPPIIDKEFTNKKFQIPKMLQHHEATLRFEILVRKFSCSTLT